MNQGEPVTAVESRALGTHLRVAVAGSTQLDAAKAAVDQVVAAVDLACSRFREDSELVRLNAQAGSAQRVSPLLGRAIAAGLRAAQLTGGLVDPTVGEAMRVAGYDVDFASIPADAGPVTVTVRAVPGWRRIRYEPATSTVWAPAGVELDLGATAKALASDLAAAAALTAVGGGGVLVSLGGDIAVAGQPPEAGWSVQLGEDSAAAFDPSADRVALHTGGLASSSTRIRRWWRGGVEMHHIIDPRTGAPAHSPWRLVTVAAATCVDANIASTAAIVLADHAPTWLTERALPARLVRDSDGSVVRVAGWPEPMERGASLDR